MNVTDKKPDYNSLDDIRQQRDAVVEAIRSDEERLAAIFSGVIGGTNARRHGTTSSVARAVRLGARIVDGALLGWKIYRNVGRVLRKLKR